MRVNIELDTAQPHDLEALKRLVGIKDGAPAVSAEPKAAPAPAAEKPAKKAAKPKPAPEPAPEPEELEKDDEAVEEAAEEKPAPAPAAEGGVDEATATATRLIGEGKADTVRTALKAAGVKRVSGLTDDNVGDFLAALEA